MDHEGLLLDLLLLSIVVFDVLALDGDGSIAMPLEALVQFLSPLVVLSGRKIPTACGDEPHHMPCLNVTM
jgi:hypothetical protein